LTNTSAVILTYDDTDAAPQPALNINGNLTLAGNAFTVNTADSKPLAKGTYVLIQASGSITSSGSYSVSGTAIGAGTTGSITISNNSVILTIQSSSTLAFSSVIPQGGTSLVFNGAGGSANALYYVLSTTNLTLPLADWTVDATNHFDGSGNFSFTHSVNPAMPVHILTETGVGYRLSESL